MKEYPTCPNCGADADYFFRDKLTGNIVGCYDCLNRIDWFVYGDILLQQSADDNADKLTDFYMEREAERVGAV